MKSEYERLKTMLESGLQEFFDEEIPQVVLLDAMRYSLLAGGKRIRPVITLKFCELCGGKAEDALNFAYAVEMIHTYSLIHDDLPCMDDDDLRRGKPTNHAVFGECAAVLAGDSLQAAAFETMAKATLSPDKIVQGIAVLSHAAGCYGMCGGQILDMACEQRAASLEEITTVHEGKTAAMIKAAAKLGVIAAGGTDEQLSAAEAYADAIGLSFQIRDDVLDIISTEEELGKTIGSDASSGKSTFPTLLGLEECERIIAEKTKEAKEIAEKSFESPEFLVWLAESLADRKY